jgi:hypothetical protein
MAAIVLSTKPLSFSVSVWILIWIDGDSQTGAASRLVVGPCHHAYLNVVLVADLQGAINTLWRRTPVFMQLETRSSRFDNVAKRAQVGSRIVAFTGESKVERDRVGGGEHVLHVEYG